MTTLYFCRRSTHKDWLYPSEWDVYAEEEMDSAVTLLALVMNEKLPNVGM